MPDVTIPDTPQTRTEQYLAAANGQEVELPTPLTREEAYLHEIATKMQGGSGVTVEPLNVVQNGTQTAPAGKAFSPVTVNVPNSYTESDEGKVVSNGALAEQTAHADVTPGTSAQNINTTNNKSVKVKAISPTKSAQTYTPGTTNQTIAAGRWLTGAQTIKGDANLVANNIKSGVSIFGVAGNYAGDGGVTFYDGPYALFGGTMFFAVVEDKTGTHCDIKAGKYESTDWGAWNTIGVGSIQYQPKEGVTAIGIYSDGMPD